MSDGNGDFKTSQGGIVEFAYGTDTSKKLSSAIAVNAMTEALGDWTYSIKGGITFKPTDRFSLDFDFQYRKTDNWLIHLDGPVLGTYNADHFQPTVSLDLFFSAKQQLRMSLQWVGIKARGDDLYLIPDDGGSLVRVDDPADPPDDFSIAQLSYQARYRWEIAPLSDLFIVYTRISDLSDQLDDETFQDLFQDSWEDPFANVFIVKLRYRFGS